MLPLDERCWMKIQQKKKKVISEKVPFRMLPLGERCWMKIQQKKKKIISKKVPFHTLPLLLYDLDVFLHWLGQALKL